MGKPKIQCGSSHSYYVLCYLPCTILPCNVITVNNLQAPDIACIVGKYAYLKVKIV